MAHFIDLSTNANRSNPGAILKKESIVYISTLDSVYGDKTYYLLEVKVADYDKVLQLSYGSDAAYNKASSALT
jgi:hypothetical protein